MLCCKYESGLFILFIGINIFIFLHFSLEKVVQNSMFMEHPQDYIRISSTWQI